MNSYLGKLNKITKSDMVAILAVAIGFVGLSINYAGSIKTGNILICFAWVVFF